MKTVQTNTNLPPALLPIIFSYSIHQRTSNPSTSLARPFVIVVFALYELTTCARHTSIIAFKFACSTNRRSVYVHLSHSAIDIITHAHTHQQTLTHTHIIYSRTKRRHIYSAKCFAGSYGASILIRGISALKVSSNTHTSHFHTHSHICHT